MKTSPIKARHAALAALLLAGVTMPAIGQDSPESLLPPGFNEPATPAPAPARPAEPRPAEARPSSPAAAPAAPLGNVAEVDLGAFGNDSEAAPVAPVDLSQYDLPPLARHSLARVGIVAGGNTPFPADGFGDADGRYLQALMRRLDAPVASRWVSIVLRRALMSPLDTPAHAEGADFAAERAWVLLRMGEAMAARAVIADIDNDRYTPFLYQIAMQSALAAADPAALCPIADQAVAADPQRGWGLAQAFCLGLGGKPNEAGQRFDQVRAGSSRSDVDNLLAEKVLGAGAQGRRAITIEWAGVGQLTGWRWGLATATGVEVPDWLYDTAGPQVRYWQALAPNIDAAARAPAAELAAAAGVFSNAGLVDLYGEIEQTADSGSPGAKVARNLRRAYSDGSLSDRLDAIKALWDEPSTARGRYARLILTARAAAWIPAAKTVEAPERLIASMLSAGLDAPAMEWRQVVALGSEGWALLALADPNGTSTVRAGDFDTYREAATPRKAQMLLAGLAGLGRLSEGDIETAARAADVRVGGVNSWTQAIDRAGQQGDSATVALLAAVGMQSRGWESVTPEALFHIVAAMRSAGMAHYARMIAVEAVTRA